MKPKTELMKYNYLECDMETITSEFMQNKNEAATTLQSAIKEFSEKKSDYLLFKEKTKKNKQIKEALLDDVSELQKKQAKLLNSSNGTVKEISSIVKDMISKKETISMYENAENNIEEQEDDYLFSLYKLSKDIMEKRTKFLIYYKRHAEEKYLKEATRLFGYVLKARIASYNPDDSENYILEQSFDLDKRKILAERLATEMLRDMDSKGDDELDKLLSEGLGSFHDLNLYEFNNKHPSNNLRLAEALRRRNKKI